MYGGISTYLSIRRPKTVAGDVTPNAVNWSQLTGGGTANSNSQTITGIDTSINLLLEYSDNTVSSSSFLYSKNGGADVTIDSSVPNTTTSANINGIVNNDAIVFRYSSTAEDPPGSTISVTVKNASDGNAVLDTFTLNAGLPP